MSWVISSRVQKTSIFTLLCLLSSCFLWPSQSMAHTLHSKPGNSLSTDLDIGHLSTSRSLLVRVDAYSCTKKKPCSNGACCGKDGYCGYGPTYCGKGCLSNCDAKAECGKYAAEGKKTCPLNVCCSQFGFCGTTEEFCNSQCQSNCGQPSVPAGGSSRPVRGKVIAYYEAWSARRKCNSFQPSNIPIDSVTHVNFAFAYIDPKSLEITTMDSQTPESLFQDVTAIKSMKMGPSSVEVWISIGGWTFSDNNTATQPVFGHISRSSTNRQQFADNLVKFMTRYGFDGVDLDWEYPGATDRGGNKEEDTKAYIELIRTLRATFDRSPRGGYGLTFTIPSSYWYLRWFDVPKMLDAGASWVNLMSYDLHGVWDKHNPIGSIVQGHTNLTEIKQSVDLLWRNDVPPGKVVLGVGFYGRSFQLADSSCNTPGCKFSGAAEKGDCTGEGGILGYFEIQDILKKDKGIKKIHDKEAAVNYITFNKDQWVSFDDATTFEQKVKWADSIGLGGLMTWAIDLDDENFSALSGLIGKKVSKGIDKDSTNGALKGASWSSDNGQDCYSTKCGERCPSDESELTAYPSNCSGNKKKQICCPRDRTPRDCRWRGGEHGGPGRACHGQCHNGELTLLFDGNGNRHCATGKQVYCCTADRYKELLDGCSMGGCGKGCDDGYTEVAKQYDFGHCWKHPSSGYKRPWCCKEDLKNCHWVGKGSCDDNNCDNDDVQLSLSGYGDSPALCGVAGRKKSLCCDAPDGIEPFSPVPLEYLFPTVPPVTDPVKWDLQILGGYDGQDADTESKNPTKDPNYGAFGFVLVAGPKDVVSSFSKRDGSHVEFVDCPSITTSLRQTTRIFCTNDREESNCDDVLQGGIDGTVVRMPDNCGPGSYVVVHSLKVSEDQSLPGHLAKRTAPAKPVMDLEFSYDFSLIKRTDDDVYLRIDYSNVPGYWGKIVDEKGMKRRRDLHPRELTQRDLLDKRFFSSDSHDWGDVFDDLEGSNYYTNLTEPATEVIINEKLKCTNESYLQIDSDGSCEASARFGFTMIGKLKPFKIDQAYGFLDFKYDLDASVKVVGSAGLDTEYKTEPAHVVPNSDIVFSHPGIISFKPTFDIQIGIRGDNASFSGEFTTHLRTASDPALNNGWIRKVFPSTAGGTRGGSKAYSVNDKFKGHLNTGDGEVQLSLIPTFKMDIKIDNEVGDLKKRGNGDLKARASSGELVDYSAQIWAVSKLLWNVGGVSQLIDASRFSFINFTSTIIDSWKPELTTGEVIGVQPGGVKLHTQSPNENDAIPDLVTKVTPYTIFGSEILTCPGKKGGFACNANLCKAKVVECDEESSDQRSTHNPSKRRDAALEPTWRGHSRHQTHHRQHERHARKSHHYGSPNGLQLGPAVSKRDPFEPEGGAREFKRGKCLEKSTGNQLGLTYKSKVYPGIHDWTNDDPRYDNAYDATDVIECTDGTVSGHSMPNFRTYCSEHVIELQTMQLFLRDVADNKLPDGSKSGLPQIYCDFMRQVVKDDMLKNPPPPPGSTSNSKNPMERIMMVHGSDENWEHFVFLEEEINAFKARVWKRNNFVDPDKRIEINTSVAEYALGLINIRTAINVFSYLNYPEVNGILTTICNQIRAELKRADDAWIAQGKTTTKVTQYWDLWIKSHFNLMISSGYSFVTTSIQEMRAFWTTQANIPELQELAEEVLQSLDALELQKGLITIDLSSLN